MGVGFFDITVDIEKKMTMKWKNMQLYSKF